ncbi:hypothetical protein [Roseateles albus]|uniref:Uncharacterized protein n=1 Tax=Roseateles albus TaxID=2987525 RepID=A0ABT5KHU6_9BURK|nr:hypothetical protein [Roseateles albus]MDC8773436.1 hypothetical protein [Roseateles albus]
MSTDSKVLGLQTPPVAAPLSLRDLAILLVKHYDLNDGMYDLMVGYHVGTGGVGPTKEQAVPGVMIGVSEVGLVPSSNVGPNTVDASEVNPKKKPRKKTD